MEDGRPICTCEAPEEPCENLTCCYMGKQAGEPCEENADCPLGLCHKPFSAEAYCSNSCQTQDDCTNLAEGENKQMCCVELDTDYSICIKLAEGYACGDGMGTCGTSCTGTLDSACDVGLRCLGSSDTDPKAICSTSCTTTADCAACEWSENPDTTINCITISGGDSYCLLNHVERCTTGRDCPEGDTCSIGISADMTELFGVCMNVGTLPPGAECNIEDDLDDLDEERCSGFYCLGGRCTEVCLVDSDCPEDMLCEVLRFSDTDATIKVCLGDKTCDDPTDCDRGESCQPTFFRDELIGWCSENAGRDPVGSACAEDNDTCEVFCIDTLCTEWCSLNEDCPEGMRCGTIDFCLTEPCDNPENTAPATVCIGI